MESNALYIITSVKRSRDADCLEGWDAFAKFSGYFDEFVDTGPPPGEISCPRFSPDGGPSHKHTTIVDP